MTGPEFEKEVRNIARALWPGRPGSGAADILFGRERDCIFEEEHVQHYLEITTSRKLKKVKKDVEKMVSYRDKKSAHGQPVKLWYVTKDEPTPHQKKKCRQNGVEILSLHEFRRRIIDAPQYIELRNNHSFGSATDPATQSSDLSGVVYQPVSIRVEGKNRSVKVGEVADLLAEQSQVVLLGDYGMGKSLNVREVFSRLRKDYFSSDGSSPIPVALNLREHWGQFDAVEALQRHSDLIGFDKPHQLIRAFNAGRLVVLLDGFDEVSAIPWGQMETDQLRVLRRKAVRLVANFVSRTRGKGGLLIAGREHFFDNRNELESAFDLRNSYVVLKVGEFSDGEAREFLNTHGYGDELPDWFPKRPLLLASLAGRGLIKAVLDISDDADPAEAWDQLLTLICQREAEIHQYLDASGIRHILEFLASKTRSTASNLVPCHS